MIYEPLYTLKAVGDQIWLMDGEVIKMNVGPLKVPFSTRMTVIKLPDGQTPLDYRQTFTQKRVARACFEKMLAWQPEKIIISHGKWYEQDGVAELLRAFRWLV